MFQSGGGRGAGITVDFDINLAPARAKLAQINQEAQSVALGLSEGAASKYNAYKKSLENAITGMSQDQELRAKGIDTSAFGPKYQKKMLGYHSIVSGASGSRHAETIQASISNSGIMRGGDTDTPFSVYGGAFGQTGSTTVQTLKATMGGFNTGINNTMSATVTDKSLLGRARAAISGSSGFGGVTGALMGIGSLAAVVSQLAAATDRMAVAAAQFNVASYQAGFTSSAMGGVSGSGSAAGAYGRTAALSAKYKRDAEIYSSSNWLNEKAAGLFALFGMTGFREGLEENRLMMLDQAERQSNYAATMADEPNAMAGFKARQAAFGRNPITALSAAQSAERTSMQLKLIAGGQTQYESSRQYQSMLAAQSAEMGYATRSFAGMKAGAEGQQAASAAERNQIIAQLNRNPSAAFNYGLQQQAYSMGAGFVSQYQSAKTEEERALMLSTFRQKTDTFLASSQLQARGFAANLPMAGVYNTEGAIGAALSAGARTSIEAKILAEVSTTLRQIFSALEASLPKAGLN